MVEDIQAPAVAPAIARLRDAINGHDLDAVAACFHGDVVSRQPAHPARSFEGVEQVRRNWATIFAAVPDVTVRVIRAVTDGGTAWTEWAFSGTRADAQPFELRGVILQEVRDDRISAVTFYMEPVEAAGESIGGSVRATVGAGR